MSEWWTYSLSDFLLFAPRTYWRLFELYNAAVVPLQAVGLIMGAALLWVSLRPTRLRLRAALAVLSLAWLWVGIAFLWRYYATINWAAPWLAGAFVVQATLLVVAGLVLRSRADAESVAATSLHATLLVTFAVAIWPLVGILDGRSWIGWEVFGVAPDPTAIGTLGMLLLLPRGPRYVLAILPAAWCVVSAATLWTMGAWQTGALVVALAAFAHGALAAPGLRTPAPLGPLNG